MAGRPEFGTIGALGLAFHGELAVGHRDLQALRADIDADEHDQQQVGTRFSLPWP